MIPTGRPLNWSDEVEQRFLAKQRLDEVAFRHDATLDNVAQASDADGYFWFCSYSDDLWNLANGYEQEYLDRAGLLVPA